MNNQSRRSFIRDAAIGGAALSVIPLSGLGSETDKKPAAGMERPRLPLRLHFAGGAGAELKNRIKAISPQITITENLQGPDLQRAVREADVWFGHIGPDDFRKAKNLRWIQCASAGVEGFTYDELVNSDVILTNAKGCYGSAIAEHAFALLFSLTRKIAAQSKNMVSGKWSGEDGMLELKGWTMGIVGFGGIGKQVGRRAKAMDMKVIAADIVPLYTRQIGDLCDELYMVQNGGLAPLLEKSDVVVSAAPHTRASEGMFDADAFSRMKKGSFFINVSRGKLARTPDLVAALRSGHLAGAGLDVTDPEPLPADHELWQMPNVMITSHIAGRSQTSYNYLLDVFVENVRRFANGIPLLNIVDKSAGF